MWLLAENLGSILEVNKLCEGSDGKHFGPWGAQCSHYADSSATVAGDQVWMVPSGTHKTQTECFPALGPVQGAKGWGSLRMLPGCELRPAWSSAQMFLMFFSATLIAMSPVIFILLSSGLYNVTDPFTAWTCKTAKDDVIRASFLRSTDHKVSVHVKWWVHVNGMGWIFTKIIWEAKIRGTVFWNICVPGCLWCSVPFLFVDFYKGTNVLPGKSWCVFHLLWVLKILNLKWH